MKNRLLASLLTLAAAAGLAVAKEPAKTADPTTQTPQTGKKHNKKRHSNKGASHQQEKTPAKN